MTLRVKINFICLLGWAILFVGSSTGVRAQVCGNITVVCVNSEFSCNYPKATCYPINAQLYLSGNEAAFNADYYNKVTGENISVAQLTQEQISMLKEGKIIKSDGTEITFTPIDKVKTSLKERQKLNETQFQNRFNEIRQRDGLDKAIDEYKKLINNPLNDLRAVPPISSEYFEKLGDEYIQLNRLDEAVKILRFNTEINKESETAFFKLAKAYELKGNEDKAIRNYQIVIMDQTANAELKSLATERLTVLSRDQ